jgi:hypothetical protein
MVTFSSKNSMMMIYLQGDLQLFKPMSLCFLEGPDAGIGILLGKNPKKWPENWEFGLNLKTEVVLEP